MEITICNHYDYLLFFLFYFRVHLDYLYQRLLQLLCVSCICSILVLCRVLCQVIGRGGRGVIVTVQIFMTIAPTRNGTT